MPDNQVPSWACSRWGNWEHDWLDCHECQENYEAYLEKEHEECSTDETSSDGP